MDSKPSPAGLAIVTQIDIEARAQDLSRAKLLRQAKVSASTYARYARGQRDMGVGTLFKIAEALGLKPSVIVARAEERFPDAFSVEEITRRARRLGEAQPAPASQPGTAPPDDGPQTGQ